MVRGWGKYDFGAGAEIKFAFVALLMAILMPVSASAQTAVDSGSILKNKEFLKALDLPLHLKQRNLVANFQKTIPKTGAQMADRIEWRCGGNTCSAISVFNASVSNCSALVQMQGVRLNRFKSDTYQLNAEELAECNNALNRRLIEFTKAAGFTPALNVVMPAGDPEEPGPSNIPADLVGELVEINPHIEEDLSQASGWDRVLWRDGRNVNRYYYLPREYRLSVDPATGLPKLTFNHGYDSEAHGDKSILMQAVFEAPNVDGDVRFMNMAAMKQTRAPSGPR